MMKTLKTLGLSALFLVIAAIVALSAYTHSADPRTWRVASEVWRLNQGWVSINAFDWGMLKLRSGKYGLAALEELKRHGATDDIRITADAVLTSYVGADSLCGDAPCGQESSFRDFKPKPQAYLFRTDLRPGQVLPHEFVIQTANSLRATCPTRLDDCVLRMQDFNGDGQEEVYIEAVGHIGEDRTSPEDGIRRVTIFTNDPEKGWDKFPDFSSSITTRQPGRNVLSWLSIRTSTASASMAMRSSLWAIVNMYPFRNSPKNRPPMCP